ncbi:MAG: TIGR03435 family protein [Bryobacteraceae bacterium]
MRIFPCLSLLAISAFGQSFDVATIKPAPADAVGQRIGLTGPGRINIQNMALVDLVKFAYGEGLASNLEIRGGPPWASKDRYNVEAQGDATDTPNQLKAKLRSLLAERFSLKFHTEQKDVDIYNLVFARADKKLGPKVKDWDGTCGGRAASAENGDPKMPRCSGLYSQTGLKMIGISMIGAADMLSGPPTGIGRQVVDKTGLTGYYDMDLEFKFSFAPPGAAPAAADPEGPSIFTAVQEQFGLKLESAKGKAEVIVVESAERPSEN